ncbi:3923_t:CDS:1, partial [Paraglomus brasilianum]
EFPCYSDDIVSPDTPSTTSLNPQYTTASDSSSSPSKTTTKSAQVPNISVPFPPDLDAQTLVSSLLNKKSGCIPTKAPNKFIIYRTEYKKALEAKGYRYKMKEISPSVGRAWRAEPHWVKDYYKRLWVQASKLLRDIQRQSPRFMDSTWISMNDCVGMSYEKDTAKREDETRKEEEFGESASNVMTNELNNNHTTINDVNQQNLYSPAHSLINTNTISATLLPDATLDNDYCIHLHGESNPHECDGAVRWISYVVDEQNGNMCGMPGNFNTVSMFSPALMGVDENQLYMPFDATYLNNSY